MRGSVARSLAGCAIALIAALAPDGARALDVELDTDTSFQLYEVRSPGARAFMARRRLLSRVSLRLSHTLEEPDSEGRAMRVGGEVQLRLDQEFGETCLLDRDLCVRAVDASDLGAWQPLAADTVVDVPAVWVAVSGLPLGASARLGRQLVLDDIGFARFDGLTLRAEPIRWLALETMGGLLVRGTSLLGTARSDPQGSIRLDADAPFAAPPIDTFVVGAHAEGRVGRWLRARVGIRHMWEQDGDVLSRVSMSASTQPLVWMRWSALGVFDLTTDEFIDAGAEVALGEREVMVRAGVDRHVPRFDPGTVWAYFITAPVDQAQVSIRWQPSDDAELGAAVRARHAELADHPDDVDGGVDLYGRIRWQGFRFTASGFAWSGSLGPLAGVGFEIARPFFGWLVLDLDVSLWHFDDPLRQSNYGTVLSEALSGEIRLSPETILFLEFQHATSRTIGHRFRGMFAVRVDLWR